MGTNFCHHIGNDYLSVEILEKGAEVKSIVDLSDGAHILKDYEDSSWKKTNPILFPIVGGLNNHQYQYDKKTYPMRPHGFAADSNFIVIKKSDSSILLSFQNSDETYACYPFKFKLLIEYCVEDTRLNCRYSIHNADNKVLPFSIGAHPGFRCVLSPSEQASFLEFEHEEKTLSWVKANGVLNGETKPFETHNCVYPLSLKSFVNGALIIKDLKSRKINLKHPGSKKYIRIHFSDFGNLGLWAPADGAQNYICIEPWNGFDSAYDDGLDIEKKGGIQLLQPSKSKNFNYSIVLNLA
jgi:galactose mutarotase-like enzyme